MIKFLVLEMFPYPTVVTDAEGIAEEPENIDEALSLSKQLQEGLILDFENKIIINPRETNNEDKKG